MYLQFYKDKKLPYIYIFNLKINIFAQVFGLIGLVFIVIAYQKKEKIDFLKFCNYQFVFTLIESILLGAMTGVFKIASGIIRNLVVALYITKNKQMPKYFNLLFILLVVVPSLFFINSWYSILPIISSIISTIVTCGKNYTILKIGGIIVQLLQITYSLCIGAYVGFIRQTVILIAIIIGLINYIKHLKNEYYIIG